MSSQFSRADLATKLGVAALPDAERETLLDDVLASLLEATFVRVAQTLPESEIATLQATLESTPDPEALLVALQQNQTFAAALQEESAQLLQDVSLAQASTT